MENDDSIQEDQDSVSTDPLLEKMKNYFLSIYQPATSYNDAEITMSTNELFEAFGKLYKNEQLFNRNNLATWLLDMGFTFTDTGKVNFEWLLKKCN